MSEIKDVTGESVNDNYVNLSMWMIEKNLTWIDIDYNGYGDSGEYNFDYDRRVFPDNLPENIEVILENILNQIVNPSFDNNGSRGNARVFIEDGKLLFNCDHSDIIEDTRDTRYDETLVDTSML
jgi:hypothetical protein